MNTRHRLPSETEREMGLQWRLLLADMRAHTSPPSVVRMLEQFAARYTWTTMPCDRCGVVAGRCRTQTGSVAPTHAERLRASERRAHDALWRRAVTR